MRSAAFGYILSAKVGTGIVAELGAMRISDEIDALEGMGNNSLVFLCATRLLAAGLVLATETLNTAVEVLVDLVTQEDHPLARTAKDLAAGAVLLTAVGALVVALLALSAVYVAFGSTTAVTALFAGLAPAVLAIVAQAVVRVRLQDRPQQQVFEYRLVAAQRLSVPPRTQPLLGVTQRHLTPP